MRGFALLVLAAGLAVPGFAAKRVSVEQLQQILAAEHGKSDSDLARELADLELTERASTAHLAAWQKQLAGEKARQALTGLVDSSAFLPPPAAEILQQAPPDFVTQRRIMSAVAQYVTKTIPRLPNFFATRQTTRFEDRPAARDLADHLLLGYEPIHQVGNSAVTVLYRDGREVVDAGVAKKATKRQYLDSGLSSWGVFGPILGTVLVDAATSKLEWSRWQKGGEGQRAVFRFNVPKEKSHYEVEWCCTFWEDHPRILKQISAYHGEMEVDPADGSILRLMAVADLPLDALIHRADVMVEYAPMEIGGKGYICPVKSVSVSRARVLIRQQEWSNSYGTLSGETTFLNDVVFDQYHLFRAEARIVEDEAAGAGNAVPPVGDAPASRDAGPTQQATGATQSDVALVTAVPPAPPAEIEVTEAAGLPGSTELAAEDLLVTEIELQPAERPVEMEFTAVDAQGQPVSGLKPEDLELVDDGVRQRIEALTPVTRVEATAALNGAAVVYGNGVRTGLTTALLLDPVGMSLGDVDRIRKDVLRAVQGLPAGERMGLYTLSPRGFDVLVEPGAPGAQLADALAKWLATAEDLARAQAAVGGPEAMNPLAVLEGIARHVGGLPDRGAIVWIGARAPVAANPAQDLPAVATAEQNVADAQSLLTVAGITVYALAAPELVRSVAEASGGRAWASADDLPEVERERRAGWRLMFVPDVPPDAHYHRLKLHVTQPVGVTVRGPAGYAFEPIGTTLKERFQAAIWQPGEQAEIGLTATALPGGGFTLHIAAGDVAVTEQGGLHVGKLDVYVAEREDVRMQAKLTGQTLTLRLKPASWEKAKSEGIVFAQKLEPMAANASLRVIVVDEATGKMGSVTLPALALQAR